VPRRDDAPEMAPGDFDRVTLSHNSGVIRQLLGTAIDVATLWVDVVVVQRHWPGAVVASTAGLRQNEP
jgi:hypothetical protein